ncbi:MAG: type II toxin-antitoxin system VapC family toxin [Acidimicrobiales bacterium]
MIFVDTSFWYAYAVSGDPQSTSAAALLARYGPRRQLITSDRVCEETWTLLARRQGHRAAVAFADAIRSPETHVRTRQVDRDSAEKAWAWLRRRDDREFSFVDASSFAMMTSLGITEALAFDGDFSAAGFVELRH